MLRRVNPVILLSLIAVLVLSIGILASAKPGGDSASDALAAATGQVGKPYAWGTDGPGTFSCVGLVRYALRSAGVDDAAPWDHMAYLSVYPTVSSPQPGDVVVYPDGAAMYVGDGTIIMANEVDQVVGYYPMNLVGTPVGFARPYGGAIDPAATDPTDPVEVEPATSDPAAVDPAVPVDQTVMDPLAVDPFATEQPVADSLGADPLGAEQLLAPEPFADEQPMAAEQPVVEQVPATEPFADELPA